MRVLFVEGWSNGLFIREHAKSVSKFCEIDTIGIDFRIVKRFGWRITISELQDEDLLIHQIHIESPFGRWGIRELLIRLGIRRWLKKVRNKRKHDLIHLNVRTVATEQFLEVDRLESLPVVVTEHSSFYHVGINQLSKEDRALEVDKISRWFADERIKRVLPVSKDLSEVLVSDFGVNRKIIQVIPNVASPVFAYSEAVPPAGKKRFLLAAHWSYPKNPVLFFRALRILNQDILSNIVVDFVGTGVQLDDVQQYLENFLTGRVEVVFHGFLSKRRLAELFNSATAFVHPTDAENLPCVIIESLVCGCPVISMRLNGIPELVNDSNGMLCLPNDEDDLASCIKDIYHKGTSYNRKKIAKDAEAKYSRDSVGLMIMEQYAQCNLSTQ